MQDATADVSQEEESKTVELKASKPTPKKANLLESFKAVTQSDDLPDTVEAAQQMAAQMQAQMDEKTKKVEEEAAKRDKAFSESAGGGDDPASQLKALMNTQQSLHRLSSVFSGKASNDKVKELSQKLGLDYKSPEIQELNFLTSNEEISSSLVTIALNAGKSEAEIEKALG